MSRWFRHYAGMMRDDKLVRVALRTKQPVERVLWVWGAILESAAEVDDGGRYDFDHAEAAYFLRADEADIGAIEAALTAAGRLAESRVVKWGDRQFQSDRSAARQSAYRERKRASDGRGDDQQKSGDGGVTPVSRHGDAPEAETDTELETERENNKQRSPEPAKDARAALVDDRFFQECCATVGADPSNAPLDFDIIRDLHAKGYAVSDALKRKHGKRFSSWGYFQAAITEAAERQPAKPAPRAETPADGVFVAEGTAAWSAIVRARGREPVKSHHRGQAGVFVRRSEIPTPYNAEHAA